MNKVDFVYIALGSFMLIFLQNDIMQIPLSLLHDIGASFLVNMISSITLLLSLIGYIIFIFAAIKLIKK
ncbi:MULTISPECIES: hypothetical protein [Romboutsia]|jgi:hypothetical protein|uniref:hypothetical protein n=1 Tax=Romboutsia TaxID=1501226 RepID=UPI00216F9163|nr:MULTISPECIES: hypothetical protein [Romboutsia]MCI9062739.1 hypothetical protein [Romboutsia sp.]